MIKRRRRKWKVVSEKLSVNSGMLQVYFDLSHFVLLKSFAELSIAATPPELTEVIYDYANWGEYEWERREKKTRADGNYCKNNNLRFSSVGKWSDSKWAFFEELHWSLTYYCFLSLSFSRTFLNSWKEFFFFNFINKSFEMIRNIQLTGNQMSLQIELEGFKKI